MFNQSFAGDGEVLGWCQFCSTPMLLGSNLNFHLAASWPLSLVIFRVLVEMR